MGAGGGGGGASEALPLQKGRAEQVVDFSILYPPPPGPTFYDYLTTSPIC